MVAGGEGRGHLAAQYLAVGCAGKIRVRPARPAANTLKWREAVVGEPDGLRGKIVTLRNYGRHGFRDAVLLARDDDTTGHARATHNFRLQVFGIDVESSRGHDDLFGTPAKAEVAGFIDGGNVAGRHPFGIRRNDAAALPGGG